MRAARSSEPLAAIGSWAGDAACAGLDPAIFFGGSTAEARQICAGCPVLAPCDAWAMASGLRGVFAGGRAR